MKLYSLKGANEEYGITVAMLRKMIKNRDLSVTKIGNKNYIKRDDIEAYILDHTTEKR